MLPEIPDAAKLAVGILCLVFGPLFIGGGLLCLTGKEREYPEDWPQQWRDLARHLPWIGGFFVLEGTTAFGMAVGALFTTDGGIPILGVFAGTGVAATLFLLRRARLVLYAVLELLAGAASLGVAASQSIAWTSAIAYVGGIYVLIRGMVNLEDGLKRAATGADDQAPQALEGSPTSPHR